MNPSVLLVLLLLAGILRPAAAGEPWQEALAQMPLGRAPATLNRTNTVGLMLNAFGSNRVVKALIFMPGATDEIYFFQRVNTPLTAAGAAPTLLDCVDGLTNHTFIRATFRSPFLLLHTTEDMMDDFADVNSFRTQRRLQDRVVAEHFLFNDNDWDTVAPVIQPYLRVTLAPGLYVEESWHFYRNTFAAWNLTQWELLEATALSGKTRFTLTAHTASFHGDRRHGPVPDEHHIKVNF